MLDGGWYINGKQVRQFEESFAAFCSVKHAVGVGNGTDAIEVALRALGIGKGGLVFTVSHTAVATVAAIECAGATPVLVDVDPVTYTMSPESLAKALEAARAGRYPGKPAAVLPVHLYGCCADLDAIRAVAGDLPLIEDCAQAHGAAYKGRPAGSTGIAGTFSFYPTKNLGAVGDGGCVVTSDDALAERIRSVREYGWRTHYLSSEPGINTRLDELQAAFLNVLLPELPAGAPSGCLPGQRGARAGRPARYRGAHAAHPQPAHVSRTLRGRRRCRRRSRPRCRFLSDQGACMSSDTSGKPTITGLVLTYNGERLLGKCLESLAFCDAVIVVDSFSSDATESIAREHGATFVQHPWSGALPQFEYALGLVETDWVVSLDQDEICSEPLRDAILAALPGAPADLCGFTPARRSWYYDRFLKHSGWYPDRLLRVFRRNGVHFTQSGAHEHIDPNGRTRELDGDILHYPYKHFREHLDKINSYAQQGADDLAARGKKGGLALGVLHGIGRFLRIYLLKKGFLDGKAGFINAVHGAFYAFLKYVRVDEGNWGFPYNHR